MALLGTSLIDLVQIAASRSNLYSVGAVRSWNLNLPVEADTLSKLLAIEPLFPNIHDGIPAVLDESIGAVRNPMKRACCRPLDR